MRNSLKNNDLREHLAGLTLLAFSLAASLAAFGCTTNKTPGNGEPLRSGPGVGPAAPTSGITSGSSSGNTTTNLQPMMSSSTHLDPLPTVSTRSRRLPLSPDAAAAVLAGNHFARGVKVLGPVNPGLSGRTYVSEGLATGQFQDPIAQLGGIVTVNSSVNSVAHVPALVNGGGGGVVSGVTVGGVTANSTVAGTAVTTGAAGPLTPTTATIPTTAGAFAAGQGTATGGTLGAVTATSNPGTLTPTVSSSVVPTPTVSSSTLTATPAAPAVPGTATRATARTAAATTSRTAPTTSATVANPVRIVQDRDGRVVVTNGKQQ